MATTMSYGDYDFVPVPLLSITEGRYKSGDGIINGKTYDCTLRGYVLTTEGEGSYPTIDGLQDDLIYGLRNDGELFEIACGGDTLLSVYPRIKSISFADGIWVYKSDYTIEMEFDNLLPTASTSYDYVTDVQETWNVEFYDENRSCFNFNYPSCSASDEAPYILRVTHNVSATGKSVYDGSGLIKPAWQQARDWVTPRLGFNSDYLAGEEVLNLNVALFAPYNHVRTNSVDVKGGGFSVGESWIVMNSGAGIAGHAIEDFDITVKNSLESPINTVSIQGTIVGLETREYGSGSGDFDVTECKYVAASTYYNEVQDRFLCRANLILDTVSTTRELNSTPISLSTGHNFNTGTISYNIDYDDRPSNCVAGARFETITITDNAATDVFASIFVLGRANGPVLQDLSTTTEMTRSVSVEVVMEPATGCPSPSFSTYLAQNPTAAVQTAIIDPIEDHLEASYGQVFKREDQGSWQPKIGRYTRNVTWVFGNC